MQKLRGGFASRAFTFDRKKTRKTDPPCPTLANLPRTLRPFLFLLLFLCVPLLPFAPCLFIYLRIPLISIATMQRAASCSCKLVSRASPTVFPDSCVFPLALKREDNAACDSSLLLQRSAEQICFSLVNRDGTKTVQSFLRARQTSRSFRIHRKD